MRPAIMDVDNRRRPLTYCGMRRNRPTLFSPYRIGAPTGHRLLRPTRSALYVFFLAAGGYAITLLMLYAVPERWLNVVLFSLCVVGFAALLHAGVRLVGRRLRGWR